MASRMNNNTMLKPFLLWAALIGGVLFAYQNCAPVEFAAAPVAATEEVGGPNNIVMGSPQKTLELTVGQAPVPPLKMFFVVDNSYSMVASQVNLAKSFESLFADANRDSLMPFQASAYLINVAQLNPAVGSSDLNSIVSRQVASSSLNAMTPASIQSLYRGSVIKGEIPGDIFGFSAAISPDTSVSFRAAPTLGFLNDGAGSIAQAAMLKAANESPDAMAAEFASRLTVYNPSRYGTRNSSGAFVRYDIRSINDNESGMCAISRILRERDQYLNPSEVAAFVLVTDEDEANASGDKCIHQYNKFTGSEDLSDGYCETRKTDLKTTKRVDTPASCTLNYATGYNVSYSFMGEDVATTVDYFKRTEATAAKSSLEYHKATYTYEAPRYSVKSYWTGTEKLLKQTSVTYSVENCLVLDGVKTDDCNITKTVKIVDGDVIADCVNQAKKLNSNAITSGTSAPVCVAAAPKTVSECKNDSNYSCKLTKVDDGVIRNGKWDGSQASCDAKAKSISSNAVLGSVDNPVVCQVEASEKGAGQCPSGKADCQTLIASTTVTKIELAKDLSNSSDCINAANAQTDSVVDDSHPAKCVLLTPATYTFAAASAKVSGDSGTDCFAFATSKKSSLAGIFLDASDTAHLPKCSVVKTPVEKWAFAKIAFSSAIDPGTVAAAKSQCSSSVRAAMVGKSNYSANSKCTIDSYTSSSTSKPLGSSTCPQVLAAFMVGNEAKYRNPTSVPVAASTRYDADSTRSFNEEIACSTLCKDAPVACPMTSGVSVTDTMTIAQYYTAAYGSNSCSVTVAKTKVASSNFSALPVEQLPTKCIAPSGSAKQYLVTTTAPYRLQGHHPDFVAGTNASTGTAKPASDLPSFIKSESESIYGAHNRPILSSFITDSGSANYRALSSQMQGQVYNVKSNNYSPALQSLSGIIKSRIERSFLIADMTPGQTIEECWIQKLGSSQWVWVDMNMWSSSGSTVTINPAIELSPGDRLRFRYR